MWIIPLSLLVVFELIADVFAKEWSLSSNPIFWISSLSGYVIAMLFGYMRSTWFGACQGSDHISVASALLAIILGLVIYKEQVSLIQIVGMFVGVVAIVLIFWNDLVRI